MIGRRTRQPVLFAILLYLLASPCIALLSSRQLRRQSASFVITQEQQHQRTTRKHGLLLPLSMVAKSGGKLIHNEKEFSDNVLMTDSPRPVLVFFTAPWCGPCRLSVPVVKDVMKEYVGQLDVVEVCTDDLPDIAADAGVVSIPTIQLYYQGQIADTIVGCVARNVLASSVNKVIEDNFDEHSGGGEES